MLTLRRLSISLFFFFQTIPFGPMFENKTVNPATLELTLPESVKVEGAEGSQLKVEGTVYEEHTFISE